MTPSPLYDADVWYNPGAPNANHKGYGVLMAVEPYIRNVQVMRCPTSPRDQGYCVNSGWWGVPGLFGTSRGDPPWISIGAARTAEIYAPASVATVWEESRPVGPAGDGQMSFAWFYWFTAPGMGWYPNDNWSPPHSDGVNMCFADGHARWVHTGDAPGNPDGTNFPGPPAIAYPYLAHGGPAHVGSNSDWPSKGISCRTNYNPEEVYDFWY